MAVRRAGRKACVKMRRASSAPMFRMDSTGPIDEAVADSGDNDIAHAPMIDAGDLLLRSLYHALGLLISEQLNPSCSHGPRLIPLHHCSRKHGSNKPQLIAPLLRRYKT